MVVTEMRVLRWMCAVIRPVVIENERIRGSVIVGKTRENKSR